jgi:hypothetical protein
MRPFVIVEYDLKKPGAATVDQTTHAVSFYTAWGIVTIRNVGNSPAYNITYSVMDGNVQCIKLAEPIALASHDSFVMNPATCIIHTYRPNPSEPSSPTLYNVKGHVNYSDGFGQRFDEPVMFAVQMGGDQIFPNKLR